MLRLTKSDWLFIAVCIVIAVVSVFVILNWSPRVFPEASIDFRYDRDSSQKIAEPLVAAQVRGMKHTAVFDGDDQAKIFLERTLGLAPLAENRRAARGRAGARHEAHRGLRRRRPGQDLPRAHPRPGARHAGHAQAGAPLVVASPLVPAAAGRGVRRRRRTPLPAAAGTNG